MGSLGMLEWGVHSLTTRDRTAQLLLGWRSQKIGNTNHIRKLVRTLVRTSFRNLFRKLIRGLRPGRTLCRELFGRGRCHGRAAAFPPPILSLFLARSLLSVAFSHYPPPRALSLSHALALAFSLSLSLPLPPAPPLLAELITWFHESTRTKTESAPMPSAR